MQLQRDLDQFRPFQARIVAVSYDSPETLAAFAAQNKITYPLLSDPESKVIDAYRVRNEGARGRQAGIPHPMTFVIAPSGKINAKLGDGNVRVRHTSAALVEALKSLQQ